MSAQPHVSVLCRRLLAALSLVVAATIAASAPGLGGRSGLQNANPVDRAILSGLRGLIEDGEPQHPDAASGDPRIKAQPPAAQRIVAPDPPRNRRPPLDVSGAPRTHAARAGLTRAPPLG